MKKKLALSTALCGVLILVPLGAPVRAEDPVPGSDGSGSVPPEYDDGEELEVDNDLGLSNDVTSGNIDDWNGPCFQRDSLGRCIDDAGVPETGQWLDNNHFGSTTPSPNLVVPEGLSDVQHHGNVRITERTTIYAHNICRIVDNANTKGAALYVGLGSNANGYLDKNADPKGRAQWVSFIQNPPQGATLVPCCVPVEVQACGKTMKINAYQQIGYSKSWKLNSASWGYNLTLTCRNDNSGIADTSSISASEPEARRNEPGTSWEVVQSGSCTKPDAGSGGGGGGNQANGGKGGGNQSSHDTNGDGKTDTPGNGTNGQVTKDAPVESPKGGGSKGSGSTRVICTYFMQKGLMPVEWWNADLKYTYRHIDAATVRGYHAWAVPYVELMRKGSFAGRLAEGIMLPIALARAEHIAHRMGVASAEENRIGKWIDVAGRAFCRTVGACVGEQDWERIYRAGRAAA